MTVIGVTGRIASGKSTVCKAFAEMGALLIDADKIGHEILEEPSNKLKLLEFFGDDALDDDGTINRARVAETVFSNPHALEWLEELTHPKIVETILIKIDELDNSGFPGMVVIDAAMLPKWAPIIDKSDYIVVIESPEWLRTNRLIQDRGYASAQIEKIYRAQAQIFEKIAPQVNYVIKNNGDITELRAKAVKVWLDIKRSI
ncbi:MAG TPA: dephospho-CoA kinase [candidate division Zixibacteria bacterium]|nr:dephospho-CoA kinase [candidate division Zixibacteria bacterium]